MRRSAVASRHMRIKPIIQSTGKRLRLSTENKTVLLGRSRKLYISARKVIELESRRGQLSVESRLQPLSLMRQLIVARLGRTEYQLLLMKISWWDRNVKIRYKCLVMIYKKFLLVSIYQPNEFNSRDVSHNRQQPDPQLFVEQEPSLADLLSRSICLVEQSASFVKTNRLTCRIPKSTQNTSF